MQIQPPLCGRLLLGLALPAPCAALMTGKYPARLHLSDWSPGMMEDNPKLLAPDWTMGQTTLADSLLQAGCASAHPGKWRPRGG